ncbi:MAG: MFS transporter [Candidatus Hydrogenedentes bacterium]|nr:MFS transporter [Candidatus Hydrogenedentota bacterium]
MNSTENTEDSASDVVPWKTGLAFMFAAVAVQLSMEYINQYGPYFLHPPDGTGRTAYLGLSLIGVAFFAGRALDALSDIFVGAWSDGCREGRRYVGILGRRRPFIFWGSLPLVATSILFWMPPDNHPSAANFIHVAVLLQLHWTALTLCAVPMMALVPEVAATPRARTRLGAWIGAGTTIGVLAAIALAGEGIAALDSARHTAQGGFSAVGYQCVAAILAVVSVLGFQGLVWSVREPLRSGPPPTALGWPVVRGALRNRIFLNYLLVFALFNIGFLAPQRVLPHWIETALRGDEGTMAEVMVPFMITSLAASAAAPLLSRWFSTRGVLFSALGIVTVSLPFMYPIGHADADPLVKLRWAQVLFACSGVGNGLLYVVIFPLIGAIVDAEERRTGARNDAVYFAFNNITWKAGIAVSIVLATFLLDRFGNAVDRPEGIYLVGPMGGLFGLLAIATAWKFPVTDSKG